MHIKQIRLVSNLAYLPEDNFSLVPNCSSGLPDAKQGDL